MTKMKNQSCATCRGELYLSRVTRRVTSGHRAAGLTHKPRDGAEAEVEWFKERCQR